MAKPFKARERAWFTYSGQDRSELKERSGQRVVVLRQLGRNEVAWEVGRMYHIRFADKMTTAAFEEELARRKARAKEPSQPVVPAVDLKLPALRKAFTRVRAQISNHPYDEVRGIGEELRRLGHLLGFTDREMGYYRKEL